MPPTITIAGKRGRLKRHGKTLDDVRAMPRDRGLRDRHHRALAGASVVFRDPDDQRPSLTRPTTPHHEQVRAGDRHACNRAHLAPADGLVGDDRKAADRSARR